MLPKLNDSLQKLWCSNNQLTMLPKLNDSLQQLYCNNNHLTLLPELYDSLQILYCYNNQLPYKLICNGNLYPETKNEMNKIIWLLERVKFTFLCLKYKKRFHDWLWIKVRLPMIEKKYHPDNLIELLKNVKGNDEEAFCNAIENW